MVSDERIAEIRERLFRASDGPWTAPAYSGLIDGPAYVGVVNLTGFRRFYDADFVAHSRSDVPYLLDALAAAQAEVQALRAAAAPIMAYLTTIVSVADQQGHLKPGDVRSDKLSNVNDVWLLRSDIERLRTLLAPAAGAERPGEGVSDGE